MMQTLRTKSYLKFGEGCEVISKDLQGKLGGIPQLVAKEAVSLDTQDIKVDVTTCNASEDYLR